MSDLLVQRPDFSAINVEDVEQLLDQRLTDCRSVVANSAALKNPDWDSLMQPLGEFTID